MYNNRNIYREMWKTENLNFTGFILQRISIKLEPNKYTKYDYFKPSYLFTSSEDTLINSMYLVKYFTTKKDIIT